MGHNLDQRAALLVAIMYTLWQHGMNLMAAFFHVLVAWYQSESVQSAQINVDVKFYPILSGLRGGKWHKNLLKWQWFTNVPVLTIIGWNGDGVFGIEEISEEGVGLEGNPWGDVEGSSESRV